MNSNKVVLRIAKKETEVERKSIDWIEIWAFVAIIGFLIFVLTPVVSSDFSSPISTTLYFLGLVMIISPVICFQFKLYSGTSDLKLDWKDLTRVWFYAFNLIFIAVDAVIFTFLNSFLRIVPMTGDYPFTSINYWESSLYWIIGFYVLINIAAFAYHWFRKN